MDEEMLRQFFLHPILPLGAKLKGGCETKGGCIAPTKPTLCTPMTKISIFGEKDEHSAVPKALRNIFCFMGHSKIVPSFLQNFVFP